MTDDRTSVGRARKERVIRAASLAACPFSIADDYTIDYLRRAAAGGKEAEIVFRFGFLPILRWRVSMTFDRQLDVAEAGRAHDEIRLRWTAGNSWLPDFYGTIRFRIASSATCVLFEGRYAAPLGMLGRVFDYAAGRHIATASGRDLTRRISDFLEERDRAYRASFQLEENQR